MRPNHKRDGSLTIAETQSGNKRWWSSNPMAYNRNVRVVPARFTPEWFEEIDRRFLVGAALLGAEENPFLELMGADALAGKRVLEIGCGMGFHAQTLAAAGAKLTTIDLSPVSIEATQTRLHRLGLDATVREMDAEQLDFPAESFDLVWSWGVVHHSSRTGRIIREIERVLRPGGETRLMVYNLSGMPAYIRMMTSYSRRFWSNPSLDENLWAMSDGFSARFYTKDLFGDLLATFFDEVEVTALGQEADAIPFPRRLRDLIGPLLSQERKRDLARRRGSLLFATAKKSG